jgi:hypothetical protein
VACVKKESSQSVAYYFSRESTRAEIIMQFLIEIIDACQNAGLQVVAIFVVCF